jgi:hypothetical protein
VVMSQGRCYGIFTVRPNPSNPARRYPCTVRREKGSIATE